MHPAHRATLRRILPLALLVALALLAGLLLRDHLTFETLRANRAALLEFRDDHMAVAMALFVMAYVAVVALSLPGGTLATLTGGFLFGLFPGALMNVTAATLGAVIIFAVVRAGLGARLAARIDASNGAVKRISEGIKANEVSVLISMRLVPALPFFMANIIPAFLGVALGRFAWTTLVGIIPGGVVYTWVGAGLGEVFDRGETPNMGIIFEPHILGPLLALAALSFLPLALRRMGRV